MKFIAKPFVKDKAMTFNKWLLPAAVVVTVPALLGGFLWAQSQGMSGTSGKRIVSPGMAAPDFTLPAQNGQPFHLSDYKGRAVFVAFVPSWTDTKTIAEVRSLAKSQAAFDAAGAKVMVASADDPQKAADLHQKEKLPFPLLTDTNNALAKRYGVPPGDYRTTFVVAPAGSVKYRLGDAVVTPQTHGTQLLDVSKCCIDDVMAARAHGIGKAVGDFSLQNVRTGKMETLMGNEAQKATVVLFLSVQCPCSNGYNERVAALAKAFADKPVRIIGVYANQNETTFEIAAHAQSHGFTFPIFKDNRAQCADHLGATVTPEAFVLDNKNVLRYAGRIDDSRNPKEAKTHDVADAAAALVAGRLPATGDTRAFGCAVVRTAAK